MNGAVLILKLRPFVLIRGNSVPLFILSDSLLIRTSLISAFNFLHFREYKPSPHNFSLFYLFQPCHFNTKSRLQYLLPVIYGVSFCISSVEFSLESSMKSNFCSSAGKRKLYLSIKKYQILCTVLTIPLQDFTASNFLISPVRKCIALFFSLQRAVSHSLFCLLSISSIYFSNQKSV